MTPHSTSVCPQSSRHFGGKVLDSCSKGNDPRDPTVVEWSDLDGRD